MKKQIALVLAFFCLMGIDTIAQTKKVNADDLISGIDKLAGKKVEVTGKVTHICGVDGKKMKIETPNKGEIMVTLKDKEGKISYNLNGKTVRVTGKVTEARLDEAYISQVEKRQILACSIDKKMCIDSVWVKKQQEKGKAAEISQKGAADLRAKLKNSKKGYISLVKITAEKIEEVK